MENNDTEYIEGSGDDFLKYLFSSSPREQNSVKIELDIPNGIKLGLHIFQELLMIFTMGLKYLYSDKEVLNIATISPEDVEKLNKHFQSFGHTLLVERFSVSDYLSNMKLPNYFKDKHLINDETLLRDIYYETSIPCSSGKTFGVNDFIYRITFDFLK
jgi:hypothetical protein|tara:strand:- start:64 stop:537 length:474 start_codon:yes stop_codon:yes gene_type:complete